MKINFQLPNTFWLYQHRVRNAYFQSCSQNKFQILIWVTLYLNENTYKICLPNWSSLSNTNVHFCRYTKYERTHDAISTTMVYQLKCRREKFVGQTEWELRAACRFNATYTVTSARPFLST